jgi:hypothetical protein
MDSSVKSLTITGTAAEDATRFRQKGSRRKRAIVKEQESDNKEKDDEFIQDLKKISLVKTPAIASPIMPQAQTMQVKQSQQSQQTQQTQQSQQTPVHVQQSNVILKPLKQPRVKLQPKTVHAIVSSSGTDTTRKARRIHLSVGNLNHRFTRAKRVKNDTEKKPMTSIREYLVGKGVIQQKSKAPEKMLRSMYSDFMLLKDQAL